MRSNRIYKMSLNVPQDVPQGVPQMSPKVSIKKLLNENGFENRQELC